jgi:hypothetical protein
MSNWLCRRGCVFLGLMLFWIAGNCTEVAFAGFSYSGEKQSIPVRFPYTTEYEKTLGGRKIDGLLQPVLASVQPKNFTLIPRIDNLIGRDQAVAVSLVVTSETVSTEQIGAIYKLLVQVRAQTVFFDFKSMMVLAAYPMSFAYIDQLSSPPTEIDKLRDIGYVYNGIDGKPGIISRFTQTLATANLPSSATKFVQVTKVNIGDEARAEFPKQYENGEAETWIADSLSEAISTKMNVPILPFKKGYAIGNTMSFTVSDGSVYSLKIPDSDYELSIDLIKLKKVNYEEQAAGKSIIYATYTTIKLELPGSTVYLDANFKNGEVKIVPSTQVDTDDFPAFQDSILGLLNKFAGVISGDGNPWLKASASGDNVDKQVIATRELLQSCR